MTVSEPQKETDDSNPNKYLFNTYSVFSTLEYLSKFSGPRDFRYHGGFGCDMVYYNTT